MNEPRTVALTLWSRLISGESLEEADRQRLIELLKQDASVRSEVEADATLNALLRFIADKGPTDDQFIQNVLDRCSELPIRMQSDVDEPIEKSVEVSVEKQFKSRLDEGVRESESVNDVRVNIASSRQRKNKRAELKRRQRSAWTAFGVTAAIFACLGLTIWFQLDPPTTTARTDAKGRAIQEPEPAANVPGNQRANEPPAIVSSGSDPNSKQNPIDRSKDRPMIDIPPVELPDQDNGIAQTPADPPDPFVTLTHIDDPVWERKSVEGDRLGNEIIRLFAGSVELTFDSGAVVTVDGPIEFRPLSTGQLELRRGRLLANVPQKAIGFTVSTPTSKIVDLGTEFEVAVNEAGESDVQVLKGEVEVAPLTNEGDEVQKWRLIPDDFNRASFFALPQIQGPAPVSASLQGRGGQFQGFVSINGKTAEFTSVEAFENVRHRAVEELVRSQENALVQWKEFVDSMQHNMQGTMKLNGQEMQFGNLQDVMRLQNGMLEKMQNSGNDSIESNFNGSININGKVMTFKTREEYEAARRAAFGPAATFGIGDVFGIDPKKR